MCAGLRLGHRRRARASAALRGQFRLPPPTSASAEPTRRRLVTRTMRHWVAIETGVRRHRGGDRVGNDGNAQALESPAASVRGERGSTTGDQISSFPTRRRPVAARPASRLRRRSLRADPGRVRHLGVTPHVTARGRFKQKVSTRGRIGAERAAPTGISITDRARRLRTPAPQRWRAAPPMRASPVCRSRPTSCAP